MTDENSGPKNESSSPNKRLVKILIIVGFGIPVLVELLTLFNLINVQFTGSGKENEPVKEVVEPENYVQGDTLFEDSATPVFIDMMEIDVSTQDWQFLLKLSTPSIPAAKSDLITVDSLRLKSGKVLDIEKGHLEKTTQAGRIYLTVSSPLPNSDIPQVLYMRLPASKDSLAGEQVTKSVPLGHIPVRYARNKQDNN